jgi:UDP-GlcNAc3NAcA epimerase
MISVLTVVGARPQFIKAAPVSSALRRHGGFEEALVHTGQHFDAAMSDVFFKELEIPAPAYTLNINSLGHGAMTGRMMEGIETILLARKPDLVLVYGDTNSTLAGTLAAVKLGIPTAHVEAGLRSFNRSMPEEINRILTDHAADLLLCPTRAAVANLASEGIRAQVRQVGDVMFDATLAAVEKGRRASAILKTLSLNPKSYAVATLHRAENTDDPARLTRLLDWLESCAARLPVIMPVHPRTRQALTRNGLPARGLRLIDPLGAIDMAWLCRNAAEIHTDSGGLQKEAYFHRVPCTTLREETEWVETIEAGWNRLWTSEGYAPRREIEDYGEGRAGEAVAQSLAGLLR